MKLHVHGTLALLAALVAGGCIPGEMCPPGLSGRRCQIGPDAGPPDAGPPALGTCERGDTEPCGTFVTRDGTQITLGRYGAAMDRNVGQGFETVYDPNTDIICPVFAEAFAADPEETQEWLDIGDLDPRLFTVYRPANWAAGQRYPVVAWGNGTCMQPEVYGALLRYVASQGFVVIAPNSRFTGSGDEQRRALDFARAANEDRSSPYYQRLDMSRVAAAGHSQGALGTVNASSDQRVDTAIIFNGGTSMPNKPTLLVTGDRDLDGANPSVYETAVNAAREAAFLFYHDLASENSMAGYLLLIDEPERVTEPTVAWLKYRLNNDSDSRRWFIGGNCRLCDSEAEFEYGQHGLN